jgi:hypothetical protein
VDEGDVVRVYGYFPNGRFGGTFFASSVVILRDDDDRNDNFRTLSGIVFSVDRNARRLDVRADNGTTFTVFSRTWIGNSIDRGDRVRVTGNFNNRTVRNATVTLQDNNNSNNDDRRTLSGDVTSLDRSARRFDFRSDQGTTYTVFAQSSIPNSIDRGDRVRVTGNFNSRTVRNATVTLIENDNDRNDREFSINFTGRVTFSNDKDTLRVRGDNGREYTVRTNDAEDYQRGDDIRVRGHITNGVVFADDIDKR